ncbi:ABC transporter ATP-binding protein [Aquimarina sp. AU119]|uniref:ATP-binding cassette domain-containing protein n=1 Tax=Aquimarina sp. AU119 TaxID=2108528 RepID=UPI000D690647|nr:ABC transporter ATP-binding protein [Aquimarina sp. AU119]
MVTFFNIVKRIYAVIPNSYKKLSIPFLALSLLLLVLDVFSIFILIPLIISLLDQHNEIKFLTIQLFQENKYLMTICIVLFFVLKNYVSILINKYQARVIYDLGSEYSLRLSKHYILGNYQVFKEQKKSSIIKEIIFVANDFVGNLIVSVNTIFSEFILLLMITCIGFYFYFSITLVVILFLVSIVIISKYYNKKTIQKINNTRSEDYDNNINNLMNLLNGYMSIKSPDLLQHFLAKFNNSNKRLNHNYSILHAKRINNSKQTEIIMVLLLCSVFTYIHFFSFTKAYAISFLSVFGALFFKAIPSINRLNIGVTNLNSHLYALDIIEKKVNTATEINTTNTSITFKEKITLKNIGFYFKENKSILNNFNLIIPKGAFISIIGKSGIGKTTLLNIIAKLIDPTEGNIYIDSIEINDTNKYNYFSLITYLVQKPFIYEGTVLDNIVLTKKDYDKKLLNEILIGLEIEEIILNLPNGMETFIGSEARNLSGGQLQRICIARALLNIPNILILDEATNNLDKVSEGKILRFIHQFAKTHTITTILISHDIRHTKDLYSFIVNLEKS